MGSAVNAFSCYLPSLILQNKKHGLAVSPSTLRNSTFSLKPWPPHQRPNLGISRVSRPQVVNNIYSATALSRKLIRWDPIVIPIYLNNIFFSSKSVIFTNFYYQFIIWWTLRSSNSFNLHVYHDASLSPKETVTEW